MAGFIIDITQPLLSLLALINGTDKPKKKRFIDYPLPVAEKVVYYIKLEKRVFIRFRVFPYT